MRRFTLVAGWLAATAIVSFIAWQLVQMADSTVSDQPLVPLVTTSPSTGQVTPPATPPTSAPGSTASSPTAPSSTATSSTTPSSTTTTTGSSTSTTSTSSPPSGNDVWTAASVNTGGATLNLRHRGDEVELLSVGPVKAPYTRYSVESAGPREVKVDFTGPDHDLEVRIRASAGSLVVDERIDD